MARVKIQLPEQFTFLTSIPVRITDLNYGGHVGNDTILSIIHEARVQYLRSHGYDELNLGGVGLIMSDVSIEFKAELFYGDLVSASVTAHDFSAVSFDIFYKLEKKAGDKIVLIAAAKTGMVCYDYQLKKVARVPAQVQLRLSVPDR